MSTIAIDFDGSVVTHEWPYMGKDIGAVPVLQRLIKNGHQLILNTMRSGSELFDATEWFAEKDIDLYGVNVNPTQHNWTKSPKAYAELYIDDAAAFCPLKWDRLLSKRTFIDWEKMEQWLSDQGYFNNEKEITTVEM